MGIKLKTELRIRKPDKNGECPIAIAIRSNGQELYYHTGIKVHPDFWEGSQIAKGVDNHDILNNTLSSLVKSTERAILIRQSAGEHLTLEQVKAMLKPDGGQQSSFTKYYRAHIDNLKAKQSKASGTMAVWETEYAWFTGFAGDVPFNQVTAAMLDRYHIHLVNYKRSEDVTGYAPTTIFKKLKKLRQVIAKAVGEGLIKREAVVGFEMVKYVEPETDYLTLDHTTRLAKMLYAGEFDHNTTLRQVAAFFLVECYGGVRFGDWSRFTVERLISKNKFKVRTAKTNTPVYLDLTVFTSLAKLLDYIKANELRFSLSEKTTNLTLKTIGQLLKVPFPLSTHDGRRTFATLLAEQGYRDSFIAEAMGISVATARRYIKITGQNMAAEQHRVGGF